MRLTSKSTETPQCICKKQKVNLKDHVKNDVVKIINKSTDEIPGIIYLKIEKCKMNLSYKMVKITLAFWNDVKPRKIGEGKYNV